VWYGTSVSIQQQLLFKVVVVVTVVVVVAGTDILGLYMAIWHHMRGYVPTR
jgi:hypothetical protein